MSGARPQASSVLSDGLVRVRWGDDYASSPWHLTSTPARAEMLCGARVPIASPMTTRVETGTATDALHGERCRECGRVAAALLALRGHRERRA